jgi:acetylornithine deacetylase/succinyl-diaminopimelate desuccinylase-like protein
MKGFAAALALVVAGSAAAAEVAAAKVADVAAAKVADVLTAVRHYRAAEETRILADFRDFLALPNVANAPGGVADMLTNANWIRAYLEPRGFTSTIVSAGQAPYVLAQRRVAGARTTVLIYAHFDGQPVAAADWHSEPFVPLLRDASVERGGRAVSWPLEGERIDPQWRLFARSAGDDKAPVIALMAALDALDAGNLQPSVNIKLILDGEEEAGSPTLADILAAHGDSLAADLMLFCDGPMHQSRMRQLVFGVRGSMTVELTTYGANRPLHSGHYGNWAPNPTDDLVRLLASFKDSAGRIRIAGYHDEVRAPTDAELAAIAMMPLIDDQLRRELALGRTEGGEVRLEALLLEPAIVVKGLAAGGVGAAARNVIRPSASAS